MIERRNDFVKLIDGGVGVELGVARGHFSEYLLRHSNLDLLISVDAWGGSLGHNDHESEVAAKKLSQFGFRSVILRMTFVRAAELIADGSCDFVYVDGYARKGPAKTLVAWWPKVKEGGIFAGHDYHEKWIATKQQVDKFMSDVGRQFKVTQADRYPSWWLRK